MSIVKGSKKASGQARQPYIAPDSAQSKTRINILYGLAEGEIEGLANGNKSILLENTPLEDNNGKLNFENVKVDFRSGTNDQDYIEGFPAVENETAIDVELKADTPWVKSFKNLDLDALRIRFKWGPLRTQDAKSGDVSGVTIEYAVDLQTDGGSWTEVLKTKISDKTSANYERAHRINLPKADSDWLVRVRRLTPNSTSEYVSDKMYIEAVTEVIDAKLRYPNTALLGLQYDAETFNNVAKIAVECKGTKIKLPSNYNPVSRKYTGMWDGTFISAYSNNPAWIYYDICTSDRYGLGDRLTPFMIDKWSLYRLGQYCDESVNDGQGGQEPRFTCNVYLQRAEEAYEILKKLAGVFRAISYWDGNSIICDADIPQDTYFTYTRANVIGEFEYSGTRARDRHNVVKVAFDNPANHYKTEYEYVRDEQAISDSGQIRVLDLNAWGCTSRGQAQRAGLWALKSEQSETRTVTFKVGLDGWIPQPGRVIEIADELFAGRANGGRVSAISEDRFNLTIDRDDVVAKPGDRLVVNGEDGKAQTRVIQSINGRVITVTLPFDLGSIAAENIWVIDAQDLATMKFRVISIRQEEKNKFTINAIQYNPQKFDEIDNGAHFEEVPISIINPTLQDPVSDISITSEDKVNQGINITTMILSWKQAKGAVKYLVEWRKDNASWIRLPLTGNNSIEVQGVYSGNYQARVTAISAFEVSSLPVYSSITELVGKKGLPPKLEYIRATGILFGMQLDWSFPNAGAQDAAYVEIRVSPDGVSNIVPLGQFAYPTNTHKVQGLQPNLIQYYSGRIVDKIGNVGPWSEWVNGTTSADPDAVLDLISGHIDESDLAKELQGKIEDTANVAKTAGQAAADAQAAATAANNAADQASAKAGSAVNLANEVAGVANNSATMAVNAQNLASKTAADLKNATDQLNKSISDEANARVTAVSQLNDGLTTETAQRKSEDASLLSNIETYKASTNGTLSSLQEQVTINATNTGANASKITSLDSRLTANEGKTGDAINAAATAQQTANIAVDQASAAANSVTALKSDFSGGKGKNAIIAPFSDPQSMSADVTVSASTVNLVASLQRVKGKAYDITFTAAAGAVYFGTTSAIWAGTKSAASVRGGKKYLLSMYAKRVDTTKFAAFFATVYWFRRAADGSITFSSVACTNLATNTTRVVPSDAGSVVTFKGITAPVDAFAMSFYVTGDNAYQVAGARIQLDLLMLEESIGDDKSASMWVAGAPDLGAIQSSLDANASAITNLTTRVTNDEGTITSHSQSITQLNNSIATINNSLPTKADASALTALDNRVTTNEGNITSQSGQITALNNSVTTINGALTTKADNSALQSLDSKVTNIGGKTDLNTSSITSLNSALNSATSSINMSGANALTDWVLVDGTVTEYKVVSEPTALSGKVLQLGDNAGNDQFWGRADNLIRIDENKTYRLRARYRRKTGAGLIYLGVAQLTVDKSSYLTDTNVVTNSMSSSNYTIAGQAPTLGEWQEVACYLKGRSTGVATGAGTINDPRSFAKQAYFISPVFIGNYNNTAGIVELDYLILEDAEAIVGNLTNANAINTLNTNVSNIDGKVTANTNSITSLSSRVSNTEGGIAGANSAINTLSTRISDAEGKLTSQSNSVTQLSDQIGNTKSYSIVTFRNGSAVGIPRDGGIHSYKGKINDFGRGLNLIVFKNGDVSSVQVFDTYGDIATACTNLNNAIQALVSGTYFAIVGTDNIGSVSIHAAADTLRTTLLACGASRSYLNTWVGNSLPIFVGRKDLDAGNGIQAMFDSSVMNQWIEYPLTFIGGVPTGMGDSRAITSLLDANASAISSLSNKVTQQGNDITSQSNVITSLNNNLAVSGKAGANLLIKSNVAGTYNGVGYPHVTYEMGEEWEVGAKYTLLWCAEHKRGAGDTNSSLWAYAGGGMQSVQGVENTNGKVINKVTFTKDGVATSKYIHFFMINRPTADKNSIGTVYWAVLVKGDLITTDSWIPSSYDFIADSRVNSSALNSLDSKVTNIDGRVTSNSNAITSLGTRIATAEGNIASNANAIANTYTKAQADEATAGQINSFNSSLVIGGRNLVRNTGGVREGWAWLFIESLVEPLVGTYTVSFDIENLDGNITGSGVGFRNPNGDFHYFWYPDSATGHKSVTMNLDSTGFVHFGIWFNNTVRLKNVKVEKGVKDTGWSPAPEDVKAGIDANASAISSLDAKVTQQGNSITSNSNSITSLSNTITNNDLTNWVRNANFADPRNDWSAGTIVDAVNAAPNPPSPKALALNYRDAYYGPMFRCNAGDMYYVSAWFASPVASGVNSTLGFHYLDTTGNHGWVGVIYTSETKRGSWTMLEGYFTVPEGMAQLHPWLQVATGNTAPNEKWHVTNIQVRNITGNKKLVSDLQANSTALNNLSSRVSTTEGNITSQSSSITSLTNQIGNTKSFSLVTFKNGAGAGLPKPAGIYSYKGRVGDFGRGLNLIVFNNGDVVSCTAYDTYGDIVGNCNALYYAVNALASGTYFAIVGTDNIRDVGVLNPDTPLRALMLACGASDKYFRSWNWTSLPIFVGRKDLDAGNGILGMFDASPQNQWIEYPLVFVSGAPQGMGDSRAITAQLDANAAAISSLSNTVTQQGNDITTQSNAITSLSASVSGIYKEIQLTDTRNDNQPPTWYWQNHGLKIVREFKLTSVLGLSGIMPDTYVTLETQVSWTDPSGGPIIQIARGSSSAFTAERRSADYNSWFPWSQDIIGLKNGLNNKADASAVQLLDAKVSTVDGKVSSQATSIVNLQTAVGGNTNAINEQSKSINGIQAIKTITIDNNGVMSGYGLISEIINGRVTSSFGINADSFYIGPPSGGKKPFIVTSTNTTINGVIYPSGTWIDTAYIASATITSAHIQDAAITSAKIQDAAITNAKIQDAAITTAKIGDLQVDTLKIKDNAVTVPSYLVDYAALSQTDIGTNSSVLISQVQLTGIDKGQKVVVFINAVPSEGSREVSIGAQGNADNAGSLELAVFLNDTKVRTISTAYPGGHYEQVYSWNEGGGGYTTQYVLDPPRLTLPQQAVPLMITASTSNPTLSLRIFSYERSAKAFKNGGGVSFITLGVKK